VGFIVVRFRFSGAGLMSSGAFGIICRMDRAARRDHPAVPREAWGRPPICRGIPASCYSGGVLPAKTLTRRGAKADQTKRRSHRRIG
jgi:hypothetical protein